MRPENFTSIREFILLGLSSHRRTQLLLFGIILTFYLLTVLGNLLIIILVQVDVRLHTPMYYFLSHLAGLEMCYVTSTLPLILSQLVAGNGTISFAFCMTDMYVGVSLASIECLLLAVMAYDRYLAICRPLLYAVLMGKGCQMLFASACWIIAPFLWTICLIYFACQTYCGPKQINHFLCEFPVLLKVACGDMQIGKLMLFALAVFFLLIPLSVILTSYGLILYTVSQMKSSVGRRKAFSTCGSHLLVVILFYGPALIAYLVPKSHSAVDFNKQTSIFYILVTPLLNPIIYTLRNKDIHRAAGKILQRGH